MFQNVGSEAGASLAHVHAQIIGMPMVPDAVLEEWTYAERYHAERQRCVYCDMVGQERAGGSRILRETPSFVALCPFAPRSAYEFWVLPTRHTGRYEFIGEDELQELAGLFLDLTKALDLVLAEPAFNTYLHTAPLRSEAVPHYHWHWEVIPRTARAAGLEWGSGCFVNAVPPEQAAAEFRRAVTSRRS